MTIFIQIELSMTLPSDIPLLINNTTFNIKNKITTHSLRGFISYAKDNYLQKYKTLCFLPNCYVCGH